MRACVRACVRACMRVCLSFLSEQHWEDNLDMFVLCAGYEASPPGSGVCIELSVTGMVKAEDGGDGQKAGARVARDVREAGRH